MSEMSYLVPEANDAGFIGDYVGDRMNEMSYGREMSHLSELVSPRSTRFLIISGIARSTHSTHSTHSRNSSVSINSTRKVHTRD